MHQRQARGEFSGAGAQMRSERLGDGLWRGRTSPEAPLRRPFRHTQRRFAIAPEHGGERTFIARLRGQTMEPVFGQMKETQGADGFMMRGEQETQGEWNLHCAAHNIKKLHSESVRRGRKGGKWLLN